MSGSEVAQATGLPPTISIVVPAYNAARFLDRTLESIRNQTAQDWECIVVDDGSKDDTAHLAELWTERDPRFRLLRQANAGPSHARNHGYEHIHAQTQYVTFMDADDVWLPEALAQLRTALESDTQAVGAHGLAEMIDLEDRPHFAGEFSAFGRKRIGLQGNRIVPWPADAPTTFETLIHVGRVYPPGLILARREIYDRIGLWDPELAATQDWDMLVRLSRSGPLLFLNQVLLFYRRYDGSISTNVERATRETRLQHYKIFFAPENTPEQKEIVRRGWKAWQILKIQEKRAALREALSRFKVKQAVVLTGHILIHLFRYLRGYPTRSGI